ncbi:unnamed protein product [Paramecium sonneborni]|uniref:Uncharacterized protein n=1 Tax=Paramecium sonneborni TaxID=65129 RepID=A0A8S1LRW0_9CILI|nr:unnamed protein product [Paramecium sonneborni]
MSLQNFYYSLIIFQDESRMDIQSLKKIMFNKNLIQIILRRELRVGGFFFIEVSNIILGITMFNIVVGIIIDNLKVQKKKATN